MRTLRSLSFSFAIVSLAGGLAAWQLPARAADTDTVDLGTSVPPVEQVQKGLFPDDECQQLTANGFKCMGFKAPVRFSLPSASFQLGSAELPDGIKHQLDVFAQALKGKPVAGHVVRIEGHADASGAAKANLVLSQKRAEAARNYLVGEGVEPDMLKAVGVGSDSLLDTASPTSAKNRRVVIGRDTPPPATAPAASGAE